MRAFASFAAALALAAPLAAQDNAQYTPEQDLDCAIVISMVLAATRANASTEQEKGLMTGFAYFVGRYEAAAGKPLDLAMSERYKELYGTDISARQKVCGARMQRMGQRMQTAGAALSALEAELGAAAQ
ncbi:MAG: hypothetical protein RIC51_05440 [Erythrobacter sp.]